MGSGILPTIVPKPCSHCSQISSSDRAIVAVILKTVGTIYTLSKFKYLHTRRMPSVSSFGRLLQLIAANLLIRKLHTFKIFPMYILKEIKNWH